MSNNNTNNNNLLTYKTSKLTKSSFSNNSRKNSNKNINKSSLSNNYSINNPGVSNNQNHNTNINQQRDQRLKLEKSQRSINYQTQTISSHVNQKNSNTLTNYSNKTPNTSSTKGEIDDKDQLEFFNFFKKDQNTKNYTENFSSFMLEINETIPFKSNNNINIHNIKKVKKNSVPDPYLYHRKSNPTNNNINIKRDSVQTGSPSKSVNQETFENETSITPEKSKSRFNSQTLNNSIQRALTFKNLLIVNLLKYASFHFESTQKQFLAKSFEWLAQEIPEYLPFKSDFEIKKYLKSHSVQKDYFINNFIKLFSQANKEEDFSNILRESKSARESSYSTLSNRRMNLKLSSDSINKFNNNISMNVTSKDTRNSHGILKELEKINKLSKSFKQRSRYASKTLNDIDYFRNYKDSSNTSIINDYYNYDEEENLLEPNADINMNTSNYLGLNYNNMYINPANPTIDIICYNENHLSQIETAQFNIFLLEKEVGQKNILPAIAVYIFQTNNYYSKIDYERFESFLVEIVNGYNRRNPYHHVSILLI